MWLLSQPRLATATALGGEPPPCLFTLGQAPKPCPPRAAATASVPCPAATGPEETQAGRAIRPSPHVYT